MKIDISETENRELVQLLRDRARSMESADAALLRRVATVLSRTTDICSIVLREKGPKFEVKADEYEVIRSSVAENNDVLKEDLGMLDMINTALMTDDDIYFCHHVLRKAYLQLKKTSSCMARATIVLNIFHEKGRITPDDE